jgi:hypothetical protein
MIGYISLVGSPDLPVIDLAKDSQALAYCKRNKNTYVVIVWPKGYSHVGYIAEKLNQHASVKYIKKFTCTKQGMFSLYRKLHKRMSYTSARKYFKPYTRASWDKSLHLAAMVLDTDAPLASILSWKKEIRDHIGASYYSIHINDHYSPETIEAAHAVFNTGLVK